MTLNCQWRKMLKLFGCLGSFLAIVVSFMGCIRVDLFEELGKSEQLVAGEPIYVSHVNVKGLVEFGVLSPQSRHFTMYPGDSVAWQIAWPVQAKGIEISGTIKYRTVAGWVTEHMKIKISGNYIGTEMLKYFSRGESFDGVVIVSWGAPKEKITRGSGKEISLAPGRKIPGVSVEVERVKKLSPATWGSIKVGR